MEQTVHFYSDGLKLAGTVFTPGKLAKKEKRAGLVIMHGFAGLRTGSTVPVAKRLAERGYVVLSFDYRGFGGSEGPKWNMVPREQMEDGRNAITYLQQHPNVDPERIGLYGASYGGALITYLAATDERPKCLVNVVGVGNGMRWMRAIRRNWEWEAFREALAEDRVRRVMTGKSKRVRRPDIIVYDPESQAYYERNMKLHSDYCRELPLLTGQAVIDFSPDEVAHRITQPAMFIVAEREVEVPHYITREIYERVQGPREWVVLKGAQHHEVYLPPHFEPHLSAVEQWFGKYLPAKNKAS